MDIQTPLQERYQAEQLGQHLANLIEEQSLEGFVKAEFGWDDTVLGEVFDGDKVATAEEITAVLDESSENASGDDSWQMLKAFVNADLPADEGGDESSGQQSGTGLDADAASAMMDGVDQVAIAEFISKYVKAYELKMFRDVLEPSGIDNRLTNDNVKRGVQTYSLKELLALAKTLEMTIDQLKSCDEALINPPQPETATDKMVAIAWNIAGLVKENDDLKMSEVLKAADLSRLHNSKVIEQAPGYVYTEEQIRLIAEKLGVSVAELNGEAEESTDDHGEAAAAQETDAADVSGSEVDVQTIVWAEDGESWVEIGGTRIDLSAANKQARKDVWERMSAMKGEWSWPELGAKADEDPKTYGNLRQGNTKVTQDRAERWASALDVTVAELFGFEAIADEPEGDVVDTSEVSAEADTQESGGAIADALADAGVDVVHSGEAEAPEADAAPADSDEDGDADVEAAPDTATDVVDDGTGGAEETDEPTEPADVGEGGDSEGTASEADGATKMVADMSAAVAATGAAEDPSELAQAKEDGSEAAPVDDDISETGGTTAEAIAAAYSADAPAVKVDWRSTYFAFARSGYVGVETLAMYLEGATGAGGYTLNWEEMTRALVPKMVADLDSSPSAEAMLAHPRLGKLGDLLTLNQMLKLSILTERSISIV